MMARSAAIQAATAMILEMGKQPNYIGQGAYTPEDVCEMAVKFEDWILIRLGSSTRGGNR
ncbi:hypothetical protein LCGC14_0879540 [marine sediment metagenome]|uniref:Uncharacterized protein n=1 Tax=marine sediment metagenome TaxID=412755 RepID=A0A0F9PN06_9ZZZZ